MQIKFVFLFLAIVALVKAKPDGAPLTACNSLTPNHGGIQPQRTQSQFAVTAEKKNDGKISVKLQSNAGEEFQGFVLQARSSSNRNKLVHGTFTAKPGETKTISCGRGSSNTLTQANPNQKKVVITEFTPANGVEEQVVFRATFLKTYETFWINVDSTPVQVKGSSQLPRPEALTSNSMYHNCMVSKGCFGYPTGCIGNSDCELLLTYSKNNNEDGIDFKLHGNLQPNQYMAFGLSMDNKMGDDSVTECYLKNSRVTARESWNKGKSNSPVRELMRNDYDSDYENGLATCSWSTKYRTESNGKRFNLAGNTHYILLAKGPLHDENSLQYHDVRLSSAEPVNFTAFEAIDSEGVSDAIKVHGGITHSSADESAVEKAELSTNESENESSSSSSSCANISIMLAAILVSLKYFTKF